MRHILLLFTVFTLSLNCRAQTADSTQEVYCQIVGMQKLLSNKLVIAIDFGQALKWWQFGEVPKDSSGRAVEFNSMVDALNYMAGNGWYFVNAYIVTVGNQSIYYYMMRKTIKRKK